MKTYENKIKHNIRVGQNKHRREEPKRRHKKQIQTHRPTGSHTQESHKYTKLEATHTHTHTHTYTCLYKHRLSKTDTHTQGKKNHHVFEKKARGL